MHDTQKKTDAVDTYQKNRPDMSKTIRIKFVYPIRNSDRGYKASFHRYVSFLIMLTAYYRF